MTEAERTRREIADWAAGEKRWQYVVLFVVLALSFTGSAVAVWTARTAARNSATIDQFCVLFERDHLADVKRLRRTYRYLAGLTRAERRQTINRFVIRTLPETEREARVDSAPEFCDEQGVGLPEPDPRVPKRPRGL